MLANLFAELPQAIPDEITQTLFTADNLWIERIISQGQASPAGFWYDQSQSEWVLLLRGAARIQLEESPELIELRPGDHLHIPAQQKHRVDWTTPTEATVWLAIFFGEPK